jgi:RNA polymerase sigma factor (sigma-70 family)
MLDHAPIADLLQHTAWMKRLARSLVGDPAVADDLVQETWVAALSHPPRAGSPVRPWLGVVLRNVLRARFRADARRGRREERSDLGAPTLAIDRVLGAGQTKRLLAHEVLALEEPYRSTILLHYYEGLSLAEVARQQCLPAATVRWRVGEALGRLRARLERKHTAERTAWLGASVPLASPPNRSLAHAAAAQGGLLMKIKVGSVVIAAAVAGLLAVRAGTRPLAAPPASVAASARAGALAPRGEPRPRLDPRLRAELLQKIDAARLAARAATGPSASPASLKSMKEPELDHEYIRAQIESLRPLVAECFEHALERTPGLDGKIVVGFTIVGDPDVGGLVTDSRVIDDKSTLGDAELRECIQENMYAARFPPPDGGGEVRVQYPFVLKSAGGRE